MVLISFCISLVFVASLSSGCLVVHIKAQNSNHIKESAVYFELLVLSVCAFYSCQKGSKSVAIDKLQKLPYFPVDSACVKIRKVVFFILVCNFF